MNTNYPDTVRACRAFLRCHPMVTSAFENLSASSCPGFEFTLRNGCCVKIRLDKRIDYAIMEVFPGIRLQGIWQNLAAEYCQQALPFPSATYFAVNPERGDVFHHSEQPFQDFSLSPRHFGAMLDRAVKEMQAHLPVFCALSQGHLPDLSVLARLQAEKAGSFAPSEIHADRQEAAGKVIRRFLEECGHNVVGTALGHSDAAFFTEILTHADRYRSYYYFRGNHLIQVIHLEIRPDDLLDGRAAVMLNCASAEKKISQLTMDDAGYLCAVTSTLLPEEPDELSVNLLHRMELVLIASIHQALEEIRKQQDKPAGKQAHAEHKRFPFSLDDEEDDEDDEDSCSDDDLDLRLDDDDDDFPFPMPRMTPKRFQELEKEIDALLHRVSEEYAAGDDEEADEAPVPEPIALPECEE